VFFYITYRTPDIRAALAAREEWMTTGMKYDLAEQEVLAQRCLEIGREYPQTVGGMLALQMAACRAPKTASGKLAVQEFAQQVASAEIEPLAKVLDWYLPPWQPLVQAAPALLARAQKSPEHQQVASLLVAVCQATKPGADEQPPPLFVETADLIVEKCAARPELTRFCEIFLSGVVASPVWVRPYGRHLRAILKVNEDRAVRCTAQFALANIALGSHGNRQDEAKSLFEQFCAEYDGKHAYQYQSIEQNFVHDAQKQLDELRYRAAGMPAPEIVGIDLDDKPLTLSEHRGKVVMMSFWATWCGPCMKYISHERELVERQREKPFVLLGVNSDQELNLAREAVTKKSVTWRSFRDQVGEKTAISEDWKILGFPTVYLIDHHGVIRKRWIDAPTPRQLDPCVEILVAAAERKVPLNAMQPVVDALAEAVKQAETAKLAEKSPITDSLKSISPKSNSPTSNATPLKTGFVEKVYRATNGAESKYVVFVPREYDGTTDFPAIMYLHGSGSPGTDGQSHTKHGLAKTIRERNENFPLIAIFPQAVEGEAWTVESPGGERALAILAQVQAEYRVDAKRISLTGHSMGGEGTWSLAAALPDRWAAIVPIAHGWQPEEVAKLKEIPCWCIHGDADEMIPVTQSRQMIEALKKTGGRPRYQELSGVGHNASSDQAYAQAELWEWVLQQERVKR